MKFNMFRVTHRPLSGAYNCSSSLWFCACGKLLDVLHACKTRGCYCSFRLLMMGVVSPETCWVLYKYGIINFDKLLHLVGFFCLNNLIILYSRRKSKYEIFCLNLKLSKRLFLSDKDEPTTTNTKEESLFWQVLICSVIGNILWNPQVPYSCAKTHAWFLI
jgi:hypothetical protein